MNKILDIVPRWVPALILMALIFAFSSRAGDDLPDFGGWDYFVKKGAHAMGYGLLALSYLRAFGGGKYFPAWVLAVLYSATDEFHQSFVPGRRASVVDVLVFDNLGAMLGLFFYASWAKKHDSPRN